MVRAAASRLHIILCGRVSKSESASAKPRARSGKQSDVTNPITTPPTHDIDTRPIRTVRWAATLIIVSSALNFADLKLVTHLPASPDIANRQFDVVVGCALLMLTFTTSFREYWRSIIWTGSALIIVSDGLTGAMHGETVIFVMSIMLMMMGTCAMLPWSVRWQGAFNILCIATCRRRD
jgi:hypothetical protein